MSLRSIQDTIEILKHLPFTGVQSNSKKVETGNIFVAINGDAFNGHHFINEAILKGALAIVGEEEVERLPIPYFKVPNSRKVLGSLAAHYYGHPSGKHTVIAITGTNGKTTTCF